MGCMSRLRWTVRRSVWNRIVTLKFATNARLNVTRLSKDPEPLSMVPLTQIFPNITIENVLIADRIPADEQYPRVRAFFRHRLSRFFMRLYSVLSPMQPGLPSIDANPRAAFDQVYTARHRRAVEQAALRNKIPIQEVLMPPALPLALEGTPDLGLLAVQGPFSGYLTKSVEPNLFEWDLRLLDGYQTRPGLYRLGVRVRFAIDQETRRLHPVTIESELGRSTPTDANWATARQIALCAVSTHTSLVRHWNWVHLIGGEYLSIMTRNAFPEYHPMCRLLWAHLFGTQASNRLCTESQLVPEGDFEAVFSYPGHEMYRLFRETVRGFTVQAWDPESYAQTRGILQAGFDTPTESNLHAIYEVMRRHTARYVALYYESDQAVQADRHVCRWLEDLNRRLPNGIPITPGGATRGSLARFAASCIYLASVHHDLLGSFLWNYQVWTHAIPCRVYKDGGRDPLDVYQRLVNTNFMLNASRTPLLTDLTPLALYESAHPERQSRAVEAFRSFIRELQELQLAMEGEGWAPWKVYPAMLEVNINA